MPYASEFRAAAQVFDAEADTIVEVSASLPRLIGPDVLQGGRLTADVEALVDDAVLDATSDAEALRSLADECRWRAEQCDAAEAAYAQYQSAMSAWSVAESQWRVDHAAMAEAGEFLPPPPAAPTRPTIPYDWIEY